MPYTWLQLIYPSDTIELRAKVLSVAWPVKFAENFHQSASKFLCYQEIHPSKLEPIESGNIMCIYRGGY